MGRIDLHAHTTASDGTLTPTELVRLARDEEVSVLAVTDHDTVDGVEEAVAAGHRSGVRVVPGIELSTRHEGRGVHVLGLFVDTARAAMRADLEQLRAERLDRGRRMVERLNELGYEISFEDVLAEAHGEIIARPHVARALAARGHVPTPRDAFTAELIADGGRADVSRRLPSPREAIAFVRQAGGVAVLAHPGVIHHDGPVAGVPSELITELAADGLAGVEVDHPDHPPEVRDHLRRLAADLDLVATAGSDFHAPNGARPGTCSMAEAEFARLESLRTALPGA